jgi:hypothetical protein
MDTELHINPVTTKTPLSGRLNSLEALRCFRGPSSEKHPREYKAADTFSECPDVSFSTLGFRICLSRSCNVNAD